MTYELHAYLDLEDFLLAIMEADNMRVTNNSVLDAKEEYQPIVMEVAARDLLNIDRGECLLLKNSQNTHTLIMNTGIKEGIIPVYQNDGDYIFLLENDKPDVHQAETIDEITKVLASSDSDNSIKKSNPISFLAKNITRNTNNKILIIDPFHLVKNRKNVNDTSGASIELGEGKYEIGLLTRREKTIAMYISQ